MKVEVIPCKQSRKMPTRNPHTVSKELIKETRNVYHKRGKKAANQEKYHQERRVKLGGVDNRAKVPVRF